MAIVLGVDVRDPDDRDRRPGEHRHRLARRRVGRRPARLVHPVQHDHRQLRARLGAVRLRLHALPARRPTASRVFWWTVLGLTLSRRLARDPRAPRRRQGDRGRRGRHDQHDPVGHAARGARDARDRDRDRRGQRDERLHRLAVAPGGRAPGAADRVGADRRRPRLPRDALAERRRPRRQESRTSCCSSATGSRRGRPSSWPTGGCGAAGRRRAGSSTSPGCRAACSGWRRRSSASWCRCRSSSPRSATTSGRGRACRSTRSRRPTCTSPTSPTSSASSSPFAVYWLGARRRWSGGRGGRRTRDRLRHRDLPFHPPRPSAGADALSGCRLRAAAAGDGPRARARASRRGPAISSAVAIHRPSISRARSIELLEGDGARRPARDERMVRQHEQPALVDERLELERPAGEDVGRARRSRRSR